MSPINLCVILSPSIKLAYVVFECISRNLWKDAQALKHTVITLRGAPMDPFLFILTQLHQKGIYSFPFKIFKETQCYYPQVPSQWFGISWARLLQAELLLLFKVRLWERFLNCFLNVCAVKTIKRCKFSQTASVKLIPWSASVTLTNTNG